MTALPQEPEVGVGEPGEKAPQAEVAIDSWGASPDHRTPLHQGEPQATRHVPSNPVWCMEENAKDPGVFFKKQAWPSYTPATPKTGDVSDRLLQRLAGADLYSGGVCKR